MENLPEFKVLSWFEIAGRGWEAAVKLGRDCEATPDNGWQAFPDLIGKPVLLDGKRYLCKGVLAHATLRHSANETVGIFVGPLDEAPKLPGSP